MSTQSNVAFMASCRHSESPKTDRQDLDDALERYGDSMTNKSKLFDLGEYNKIQHRSKGVKGASMLQAKELVRALVSCQPSCRFLPKVLLAGLLKFIKAHQEWKINPTSTIPDKQYAAVLNIGSCC